MKEELHQMLDGELPDDAMAELLHLLSVDPEKRRLFRQQMVLQHALVRNEATDTLTPDEDLEMLSSLSRAVGITEPAAVGGWKSWMAVGMLTVGLFVGGGAGYLLGASYTDSQMAARTEPAVERLQIPPAPIVVQAPINRDSLVTALRDSLTRAIAADKPAVASSTVVPKSNARAQTTRPSRVRSSGKWNDPTGAPEAAAKSRNKRPRR